MDQNIDITYFKRFTSSHHVALVALPTWNLILKTDYNIKNIILLSDVHFVQYKFLYRIPKYQKQILSYWSKVINYLTPIIDTYGKCYDLKE